MSNEVLAAVVVPIVVAVALAVWIIAVYRADNNPEYGRSRRGAQPWREVSGGSFRGRGGRQVMPLPNTEPDERDAARSDQDASTHYMDTDYVDFAERGQRRR
jgi:hypothetical protein